MRFSAQGSAASASARCCPSSERLRTIRAAAPRLFWAVTSCARACCTTFGSVDRFSTNGIRLPRFPGHSPAARLFVRAESGTRGPSQAPWRPNHISTLGPPECRAGIRPRRQSTRDACPLNLCPSGLFGVFRIRGLLQLRHPIRNRFLRPIRSRWTAEPREEALRSGGQDSACDFRPGVAAEARPGWLPPEASVGCCAGQSVVA